MKKVVVITGGGEGLGKEIAKKLVANNHVVLISKDLGTLQKTASQLKCDFELCDVTNPQQVAEVLRSIIKKHKQVDVLINNAGVWIEGPLEKNDLERIRKVIDVNILGVILCSRAVISWMKKQNNGLILNVVSQAGFYAKSERSVYNASKWAIAGFTKSLALELSKQNIIVSGIYPGKMKTNLFKNAGIKKDLSDAIDPKEVAEAVEFIITRKKGVVIPELGVKDINN